MATLRRQTRSRTASMRQDRGSCSSTASCPVFSGSYSDLEEDPPLRRQSSPLLKGSLSSLQNSDNQIIKGSISSLRESAPCLQGSLPSLRESLSSFKEDLCNLQGSISRMKRRSLGSLDNSNSISSNRSISPSLQSHDGSSSDDDGSWDTNSWSSGATCLLRTPVQKDHEDASAASGGMFCIMDQEPNTVITEPEIIYQNLIVSRPTAKTESKQGCPPKRTSIVLKKDAETQSLSSSNLRKTTATASSHQWDKNTEDKRKFSQFLNEVSVRVLKNNGGSPQPQSSLRPHYPSPPPPPPSTPSHPSLATALHSTLSNQPSASSPTSAANLWYSPTNSNLHTIKEHDLKDTASSIHQWSKALPSCKILEPADVFKKVKGESHLYPEHDLELCTKMESQPSTGRLYLETDIDRVRQLDELVGNGTLGKERSKKGLDKCSEKRKEREKRKESLWGRDTGTEQGKKNEKGSEKPSWEKDRRMERGREKKAVLTSYRLPPPPQSSRWSNPSSTFTWPEEVPRMSHRSTSLTRPANITVSTAKL